MKILFILFVICIFTENNKKDNIVANIKTEQSTDINKVTSQDEEELMIEPLFKQRNELKKQNSITIKETYNKLTSQITQLKKQKQQLQHKIHDLHNENIKITKQLNSKQQTQLIDANNINIIKYNAEIQQIKEKTQKYKKQIEIYKNHGDDKDVKLNKNKLVKVRLQLMTKKVNPVVLAVNIVLISMAVYSIYKEINPQSKNKFDNTTTTFQNIFGMDDQLQPIQKIINIIQNPKKAKEYDIQIEKGILLYGPPGNGKSLIAKAIAGELKAQIIKVRTFSNLYVESGAASVRKVFNKAIEASQGGLVVLLMDEADSLFPVRNSRATSSDESTNELIRHIDMINNNNNILIVATTNHKDLIDTTVIRPGRFGNVIKISNPVEQMRFNIIQGLVKQNNKYKLNDDNIQSIAKLTEDYSVAKIKSVLNTAKVKAYDKKSDITYQIISEHITKHNKDPSQI